MAVITVCWVSGIAEKLLML